MRMVFLAIALTLMPGLSWAERDIYDKCETTLRLCFQRCMDRKSDSKACNMDCNTSSCEGVSGPEKPLTEFLNWKNTKGKVWI